MFRWIHREDNAEVVRIRDQDESDSVEAFAREYVEGGHGGQEGAQEDNGIESEWL